MTNFSSLRKLIGCTLLGASLMACGVENKHQMFRTKAPLAAIPTTADTLAETGVVIWEVFEADPGDPDAGRAFAVVARDAHGQAMHVIKVETTSRLQMTNDSTSNAHRMVFDSKGKLLKSTIAPADLSFSRRFAHDVSAAQMVEYGCIGDIIWALGGLIVSIPVCAATIPGAATGPLDASAVAACLGTITAGPVAGMVSVFEDCGPGDDGRHFQFEDNGMGGVTISLDELWNSDDWGY